MTLYLRMATYLNAKVAEMKRQRLYCQLLKPIEYFRVDLYNSMQ
ncbi:hypothetical protein [Neochlamydia sp. TUME1]|nr:hypothetical protein [Neochlamydia sp. TUME1]